MNNECTRLFSFFNRNLDTVNRKQKYIAVFLSNIFSIYVCKKKYISAEIKNKNNMSVNWVNLNNNLFNLLY